MEQHFTDIEARSAALLLTEANLCERLDPPVSWTTYWRAKSGTSRKLSTRIKLAQRLVALLDRLEAEKAA